MGRIVHFEINADDPDKAAEFYRKAFDWEIKQWEKGDYWMVMTGPRKEMGIDGGIAKREGNVNAFVNIIAIDKIDESLKKIEDAGGKIVSEKMDVPGIGLIAYCHDNQGNKFGIIQPHGEWKE